MLSAAASVSTVRFSTLEVVLVVTSLALMRCTAEVKVLDAKVHTPWPLAVVVPNLVAPSYTSTCPLSVAVTPVSVGVMRLVMVSPLAPLSLALTKAGEFIPAFTVKV